MMKTRDFNLLHTSRADLSEEARLRAVVIGIFERVLTARWVSDGRSATVEYRCPWVMDV